MKEQLHEGITVTCIPGIDKIASNYLIDQMKLW
jgi:hypothetical protein